MNTRPAICSAAAALLAFGAAAQEPGGAPQTNEDLPRPAIQPDERLEEPGKRQRQRFEERRRRLQELSAGEDFSEFESETLEEMERERRKALARGEQQKQSGMHPIEQQMFQDSLNEFGLWGKSLCFSEEPDLSNHEDYIPHRQLVRLDFHAPKPSDLRRSINSRGRLTAAYSVIEMSCVLNVALENAGGNYHVRAISVRYFPLLSRARSWWNPQAPWHAYRVLAHQQVHFDLAELLARERTFKAAAHLGRIRGAGPSAESARADFQQRWAAHMKTLQDDLHELERAYDRDTEHGADARRQRAWRERLKRGYAAVQAYLQSIPPPPSPAAATPPPGAAEPAGSAE